MNDSCCETLIFNNGNTLVVIFMYGLYEERVTSQGRKSVRFHVSNLIGGVAMILLPLPLVTLVSCTILFLLILLTLQIVLWSGSRGSRVLAAHLHRPILIISDSSAQKVLLRVRAAGGCIPEYPSLLLYKYISPLKCKFIQ